jgi:hypothetical protein
MFSKAVVHVMIFYISVSIIEVLCCQRRQQGYYERYWKRYHCLAYTKRDFREKERAKQDKLVLG